MKVDDSIRVTIDLEWREDSKAWVGRASIQPGARGVQPHATKLKIKIQKMASVTSGEEYRNVNEAYETIRVKTLGKIMKNWGRVPNDKIRVTVRKEVGGSTVEVDPDELEEGE